MAVDKNLTPNVSGVDLDAFVNGSRATEETAAKSKGKKARPQKPLAKSKDPNYHKLTLYLPVELINQLKTCVASEPDKDVSDISAELYTDYVSKTMAKMIKEFG